MRYPLIADTVMAVHFAFLAYVVCGGFLAWRWPRMFWPHLAAAAYGLGTVVVGCVFIGLNLLSDILYRALDPRAR